MMLPPELPGRFDGALFAGLGLFSGILLRIVYNFFRDLARKD